MGALGGVERAAGGGGFFAGEGEGLFFVGGVGGRGGFEGEGGQMDLGQDGDVIAVGLGVAGGDEVVHVFGGDEVLAGVLGVVGAEGGSWGRIDVFAGGEVDLQGGGDGFVFGGIDGDAEGERLAGEGGVVAGDDFNDADGALMGDETGGLREDGPAVGDAWRGERPTRRKQVARISRKAIEPGVMAG